jgi:hypothetical protein
MRMQQRIISAAAWPEKGDLIAAHFWMLARLSQRQDAAQHPGLAALWRATLRKIEEFEGPGGMGRMSETQRNELHAAMDKLRANLLPFF